ncbi:hypothetical protein CDAR_577731 [Caerostris darwini]|uniref:Uncharacterized protein n=1 Tax=Caerostris darwini TaxID=1538125 RepID=A0AAV4RFU0_9ARAC|nr:hypothetical protein CDAR_577731 [Caerostris darwini]
MSPILGGDLAWRNNASALTFEAMPFRILPVGSSLSKRAFVLSRHASSGLHSPPFAGSGETGERVIPGSALSHALKRMFPGNRLFWRLRDGIMSLYPTHQNCLP